MIDESRLIEQISDLLKTTKLPVAEFVQTDIAAIIPDGVSGYSLNLNKRVNGIKIGFGGEDHADILLRIISNFKHLERLVFFSNKPYNLPNAFAALDKLVYLDLKGVEKMPEDLFKKGLPFYLHRSLIPRKRVPLTVKSVERLNKFKAENPQLNLSIQIEDLLNSLAVNPDVTPNLFTELRWVCSLTPKRRSMILSQTGIFVESYEQIKDPPSEIVAQGTDAILQYFREKEIQGTDRLYEAKIVIVGAGESGKTTLIRKLQNPNHPVPNVEDKRTEGIRVTTYPFSGNTIYGMRTIHAHIWDFGGQELYHTTHQLFLTPDTLYILLNDNRKNDTDFYYWLNIVTLRAGDTSPILMVFNAKDNAARQIIPGEEIYSTFPNLIKQSIDVNFADQNIRPIEDMKKMIENHFAKLDVLGKPFPAYWVKVRESLGRLSEEYINWNAFKEICENNGIKDVTQMQVLALTLHNLGVFLYFPDVFGLEDLIILKSQWCIDAIYSALDTAEIIKSGGKFNEHTLSQKWSGVRFAGNHLQLLKLMQHFDLCYKIDGSSNYIAPQLLPIEENKLKDTNLTWALLFQFDYMFMPAGLITRLIARMSLYIKSPYLWRSGVVLEWEDGTIAEVIEHQLTHKIVIKINGPERRRRLLDIRKCLYDLQKDFRGLKFTESIICNCSDCAKGGDISVFELRALEDDAIHGDTVTCRNGTRKKIQAKLILDGINYEDKPRIFISYSHQNESFKDEFRTMISPLEREGHWKVWDDRWLLPDDNWNYEIIKHLNEANVIVLMLTADFFKSDFIYNIELARAIQRHENGDALVIGIVVSDCLWEETPLAKIQILPKDAIPIDRNTRRSEVWKDVANRIKATINVRNGKKSRVGGWDASK